MAAALATSVVACEPRDDGATDAGSKKDAGSVDAGTTDGGNSSTCGDPVTYDPTKLTVAQAIDTRKSDYIEIDDAIVVASHVYNGSGTFYIQDPTGGPGLAVYRSYKDETLLPNIGDKVTVKGRLTSFSGSLQIATSCAKGVFLSITSNGTGTAMGGAMDPAGTPVVISAGDQAGFSHTTSNAHPELIGQVVTLEGPLTVTDKKPAGLVSTSNPADGPTKVTGQGFEITGGIWVDDDLIYTDCIKPLGDGTPDLTHGIRGVWERYQDFYGGTGTNPAPTYPVLKPLNCADVSLTGPSNE